MGLTALVVVCITVSVLEMGDVVIVLVCGGRDFSDRQLVFDTLDRVLAKYTDGLLVVHGSAKGADLLAEEWCKARQVMYVGAPAQWDRFGKAAGMQRNRVMRDVCGPKACIAFRGGVGTLGMINLMREVGVEPWKVGWDV